MLHSLKLYSVCCLKHPLTFIIYFTFLSAKIFSEYLDSKILQILKQVLWIVSTPLSLSLLVAKTRNL